MNRRRVLLVEDNPADADVIMDTLREGARVEIELARDGQVGLDMLRRAAREEAPMPNLVLLDLNLPKVGGLEVLAQMRSDPQLHTLPTIVLSSSARDTEIAAAYRKGANSYLVKPLDYMDFIADLRALARFWLSAAKLP